MKRIFRVLALLGLVVAAGACDFDTGLDVDNTNNPDQQRALANAGDIETLVLSGFRNFWDEYDANCYPGWALSVAADESSASWGNCGMQDISEEPRKAFPNSTGYGYRPVVEDPWFEMYSIISSMNDGLRQIEADPDLFEKEGIDMQRMKTMGKFVQGLAHAILGLHFDQAFVFTEDMDLETTEFELQDHDVVFDAAMDMLDAAIAEAGKQSFTIPDNWISAPAVLTNQDIAKIASSYSARFLAGSARTPQDRDKLDWNDILRRIDAGITEDFGVILDDEIWDAGGSLKERTQNRTWFRTDYRAMIGPCDVSGGYQAWLATPPGSRTHFRMDCLDKRIQGNAPGQDGTDFKYREAQNFRADRGTYHFSRYYSQRWTYIQSPGVGFYPVITRAEMDLLKAEAYIRLGRNADAAALINKTRVARGGLPPVTADGVSGPDCVPKKLLETAGGCADLWETLIYEKRVELYPVSSGVSFWDARGWDVPRGSGNSLLVEGTPYHLPIPAAELETLGLAFYTFGGVGGQGAAN